MVFRVLDRPLYHSGRRSTVDVRGWRTVALAKAVVITGASSGIGEACALHLDRIGYRVFAGIRKESDGQALTRRASNRLTPVFIDVTKPNSIASAKELIYGEVSRTGLYGLVNNAGIVVAGPLECVPLDSLRRQFEVNVLGQVAVLQAFIPLLREGRGRVINMGSTSGRLALPLLGPYAASKFALEAITDTLRLELRRWAIPVSIIEPGTIATPIWDKSTALADEIMQDLSKPAQALYHPLVLAVKRALSKAAGKAIPPERVARVVAGALTAKRPRARYVVGWDARLVRLLLRPLPAAIRDRLILSAMTTDASDDPGIGQT